MLAIGTFLTLVAGPQIIGYIPVCVVGALIFHLSLELMKEAIIDTYGQTHPLEQATIIIITISMTLIGFVEGIILGMILACIFFVVLYSHRQAVRDECQGDSIQSTVRRLYRHRVFLDAVAKQIHVVRLQGFLFFGTVGEVEHVIREAINNALIRRRPLRFLVVDFQLATGVDLSASEAFVRIHRLLRKREIYLVICGLSRKSGIISSLESIGLLGNAQDNWVKHLLTLNEALEWCENMQLEIYQQRQQRELQTPIPGNNIVSYYITSM